MIDDDLGEAMRATERLRLRTAVDALRKPPCTHWNGCDCGNDAHNDALDAVMAILDNNPHPATP